MSPDIAPGHEPEVHAELRRLLDTGDAGAAVRDFARRAAAGNGHHAAVRLRPVLEILEARAFDLTRPLALRSLDAGQALLRTQEVLDGLRDLALPLLGEDRPDVLAEVRAEVDQIATATGAEPPPALLALRPRLDAIFLHGLRVVASRPPSSEQPGLVIELLGSAEADLLARGPEAADAGLPAAKSEAWRNIEDAAAALAPAERRGFLSRLADDVNDRAEDALARIEGLSPEAALVGLASARGDVERLRRLTAAHGARARRRDLRRLHARLRAAEEDRVVRAAQERQVGRRLLRALELGSFVLILGLLAILLWLVAGSPDEATVRALTWADTALCLLLLTEFAWRWSLAGFGLRYLGRCLLTDVLPSIPFAFLAGAFHATAAAADAPQVFRAWRLARLAQALRMMQPAVQAWRCVGFALLGLDRYVRRHASLLNRNIVLFEEAAVEEAGAPGPGARLRNLHFRAVRALRLTLLALPPADRARLAAARIAALDRRIEDSPALDLHPRPAGGGDLRDLRIESLIQNLATLDPDDVVHRLGLEGAGRLARVLAFFDAPLIRRLPILRRIVPGLGRLDPVQAVVRAGQNLGHFLDEVLDRIRVLADLKGIVTGSQLLDRLGSALIRATARPAVRLLLLGFFLMLLSAFIGLFGASRGSTLTRIHDFLRNVLGTPLLILGGACLVVQAFGRWIRHLAGQATDLYDTVAEAQGIDLVKFHKLDFRDNDLPRIFDRALAPEVVVTAPGDDDALRRERAAFLALAPERAGRQPPSPVLGDRQEQVLLLYLDYLGGGILHKSNVKSTEQFLGNLDLEAIRIRRLGFTRRDLQRLRKLDLRRDRALPTGPYLWFSFITESLAQKTARLVLEYDRYAVPAAHRDLVPPGDVAAFDAWLQGAPAPGGGTGPRRAVDVVSRGSAQFTALHFLDATPERDRRVEEIFGPALRRRLEADRRNMIRTVFATYPYGKWPRHRRTVNPYTLYFRWFGGARILILPFRLTLAAMVGTVRGARFLAQVIKEQIQPLELGLAHETTGADLEAALRKINRMHRPLFMAALDLRARFDPEYAGVPLPRVAPCPPAVAALGPDLDLVGARADERERYRRRQEATALHLSRLEQLLQRLGWPEVSPARALDPNGDGRSSGSPLESLRAVAIAYSIDYRHCRSLIHGDEDVDRIFRDLLVREKDRGRRSSVRLRGGRGRIFDAWFEQSALATLDPDAVAVLRRAYAANLQGVRSLLVLLAASGGVEEARRRGLAILAEAARHPVPWSQQLVSLRGVQTMTCLDILNAQRVVTAVGAYGRD